METSSIVDETDISMSISISGEVDEPESPVPGTSGSTQPPKRKVRYCDQCPYSTYHKGNYSRHKRAVHLKEKHSCDTCSSKYSSKYDLVEHIRTCHDNVTLLCEVCSKSYNSRKTLRLHKAHAHESRDKFKCKFCSKTFRTKAHYHGHINSHVNSKPYSCSTCSKSYAYKSSYNRHLVKCTGDTHKYTCDVCQKAYSSTGALKDHMEGKHGQANKYCVCGKVFAWRTALLRHRKKCKALA